MAQLVSVLLLLGPCAALSVGCGPSVQSIYEGNVRFEHCYRLDLDRHIAPTHREACWREWQELYTYGQTRDRVEYADRRIRALASGDDRRPVLDTSPDQLKTQHQTAPTEAPIPTSLHAPPPPTAPVVTKDAGPPDASLTDEDVESDRPDQVCAGDCDDKWDKCGDACTPAAKTRKSGRKLDKKAEKAAAARKKACTRCRSDYRKCMRRCFK